MKRLARILIVCGVLAVGLIAAGIAILKSVDIDRYRPLIEAEVETALGREVILGGPLKLQVFPELLVTVEDVALANAPWAERPEMATVSFATLRLAILPLFGGEMRIESLFLNGLVLSLETDAEGRNNWTFDPAARETPGAAEGASVTPTIGLLELAYPEISYRDGRSGTVWTLSMHRGRVWAEDDTSPIGFEAEAASIGYKAADAERPALVSFHASGEIGSLDSLMVGEAPFPLEATLTAWNAEATLDGAIGGDGSRLNLSAETQDLQESLRKAASDFEALKELVVPALPARVSGEMAWSDTDYRLKGMKLALGESEVSGEIALTRAGARPRFDAVLSAPLIDLRSWRETPETGGENGDGAAKGGRVLPASPLPWAGLRDWDGALSVTVTRLAASEDAVFEQLAARAKLESGRLEVVPVTAELAGGRVEGHLVAEAATRKATLRLEASGVMAGQLIGETLEGAPSSLKAELSGGGENLRALAASLDGVVLLEMGEGTIRNSALDLAGGDVASSLLPSLMPFAETDETSKLVCALAHVALEDGIAKAENGLALQTDKVNVLGGGRVNLKTEEIDLGAQPSARKGLGINLSATPAGVTRLGGTLGDPEFTVDKIGAAKTAASVAAALATGGLSLVGQWAWEKSEENDDPCAVARAGGRLENAPPAEEKKGGVGGAFEEMRRGVGEGLDKLLPFGK